MIRHNFKYFAWMIVILTLCVFFSLCYIEIDNIYTASAKDLFKVVSQTVCAITIYGFFFNRYLWHLKVFTFAQWFVKVPYLAGEWTGTLKYYWDDNWQEKDMSMHIKQTFLHIQVSVYTNESWSKTIGGTFDVDEENGFSSLIYTYHNTPNASVLDHSPIHYGTAILSIANDCKHLRGNYFTGRKTIGEMKLTRTE